MALAIGVMLFIIMMVMSYIACVITYERKRNDGR